MKRFIKKTLIYILIFALSLTNSTLFIFADGACAHVGSHHPIGDPEVIYMSIGWASHWVITYQDMICYSCGTEFKTEEWVEDFHVFDRVSDYWTENHYHSGNLHYLEFYTGCICGRPNYDECVWVSYPCPGGGKNCNLPWSYEPPHVTH